MEPVWRWVLWGASSLIGFGVLEYFGVTGSDERRAKGKRPGTLTATLRFWLGIDPPHWRRWILGPLFGGFCFYLFTHILFGWFMF